MPEPCEPPSTSTPLASSSSASAVGTPRDVTVEELRIESFHPVDEATSAAVAAMGG